jgi:hypothetical protein
MVLCFPDWSAHIQSLYTRTISRVRMYAGAKKVGGRHVDRHALLQLVTGERRVLRAHTVLQTPHHTYTPHTHTIHTYVGAFAWPKQRDQGTQSHEEGRVRYAVCLCRPAKKGVQPRKEWLVVLLPANEPIIVIRAGDIHKLKYLEQCTLPILYLFIHIY